MRQSFYSRKGACCAAAFALFMSAQAAMAQGGPIVISQLFGGGGQTAAGPNGDFVELFNRSCVAVNLDGYSIQIASGGGGFTWNVVPLPNFQLDPGKYYCLRLTTTALGNPFTHDQVQVGLPGSPSGHLMLASSGKAAIVLGDTPLASVACPAAGTTVDFVKYEGLPVPPATEQTSCTEGLCFGATLSSTGRCPSRRPDVNGDGVGDGCQDTNVNKNDFMVDLDPCVPRNSSTPANLCPGAVTFGGCDLGDGTCRVVAGASTCTTLGGTYLGDCTPCVAPQACCLPTTPATCVVESELECQIDGGVFNPGLFDCPPPPFCPALGRCCSPDGTCVVTFEVLCVSPNTYGGNGTNCTGTPCQGRCCDTTGGCNVVGPDQCVAPSVFAGLGTDCAQPETCQGRCCSPDGTCTLTGTDNCLAPNTFGGVGTNCQNVHVYGNPDPPTVDIPTGAPGITAGASVPSIITVPDNFSIQDVDVSIKITHTWRGDIIMCLTGPDGTTVQLTSVGSCTAGGVCGSVDNYNIVYNDEGMPINCASPNLANLAATPDQVFPAQSLAAFDGLPSSGAWTLNIFDAAGGDFGILQEWSLLLDDGNACQGACCFTNGSCQILAQAACGQQGGTFQSNGQACSPSPCAPNGACCVGGTCSQQSQIDCGANGGIWTSAGTSCDTPPCFVPCCKQNGVCQLLTLSACNALQFSVAGAPGSPCPGDPCIQIGACCFEDGTCQAPLTDAACTGLSGVRWRGDEDCTPNGCQGRCCAPDGSCTIAFPANCTGANVYGGDATNCDDPLTCQGRCCANDGSCTQTGPGNCTGQFGGIGISCNAGYDMSTIEINFTDISGSGALVTGADNTDDGVSTGAIPLGFTFNFYGTDFTDIFIGNNGLMSFVNAGVGTFGNVALPAVGVPNNAIYPLWDDLDSRRVIAPAGGYPNAFLQSETQGAPGSQVFIVQWTALPQYVAGAASSEINTFQAKLFEGTNRIEFHYLTVAAAESAVGDGTTIGIENADASSFVQYDTIATARASLGGGGTALRFAPAVACTPVGNCTCTGDLNSDTVVNGKDVNLFAQCVASGGAGCPCADMDNSGSATSDDVSAFVTKVLNGTCP